MSFPLTIRDQANAYYAAWKKKGYGSKETPSAFKEKDLLNMKFLEGHARVIIGQMDLMFAPVPIPVFVAPSVPGVCTRAPWNTKNLKDMGSSDESKMRVAQQEHSRNCRIFLVY